jgi:carbon-monoxide dehydrogenase medium subunit
VKPAPFRYEAPSSLPDVLDALASGDDARALAGGQSLLPLLALRLAQPELVVDLRNVAELQAMRPFDGGIDVGAMVSQSTLATAPGVHPLLHEAIPLIAHAQIRNRGTIGGSLAHADPSAELPAVAVALGATLGVDGPSGPRTVAASDFFESYFTTTMTSREVLVSAQLPSPRAGEGWAILEVARRQGDFALAGVAVRVVVDDVGDVGDVALVPFATGERPAVSTAAADVLVGQRPTSALLTAAARWAAAATDPPSDPHASGWYRRHAVAVLAERALGRAIGRAASGRT